MEVGITKKSVGAPAKLLPPCCVCASPGTGLHYGVTTCEPCKGFFRRCLVRGKPPKCRNNNTKSCDIMAGVKNPCAGCRYKKCIEVGMSKEAIKLGRYNLAKKTKDIIAYKQSTETSSSKQPSSTTSSSSPGGGEGAGREFPGQVVEGAGVSSSRLPAPSPEPPELAALDPGEEKVLVLLTETLRETLGAWRSQSALQNRDSLPSIEGLRVDLDAVEFMEEIKKTGMPPDNRMNLFERWAKRMCVFATRAVKFMKKVPGFRDLHENDQSAMVKDVLIDFDYIIHRDLLELDTMTTVFYDGETACTLPVSVVSTREIAELVSKATRRIVELDLTPDEECVLLLVSAFSTDRAAYQDYMKIQSLQDYYVNLLLKLLARRCGDMNRRKFSDACHVLALLRSCSHYSDKLLQRLIAPLKVTSDFPPLTMEIIENRVTDVGL